MRRIERSHRLGIRSRLALILVTLVLVVLASLIWSTLRLSSELAFQAQREQAAALLQSLAPSSARAMAVNDLAGLDDQLAETVLQVRPSWTSILYIEAYDSQGHQLLRAGDGSALAAHAPLHVEPEFLDCALLQEQACWLRANDGEGESMLFVSVPARSGLRWGTLVGAFDIVSLEGWSQRWSREAAALIAVLAALMYVVVWLGLTHQVMAPLERLTRAVRRMEDGDLGARVALDRRDELGELAQAFDSMAARLQAQTRDLEAKVAERSARIRLQNEELERVNTHLAGINAQLERLATTDALTGLHNRRYLQQSLDFELARAQRASHPFCLLLLDIDHFKRVNDTWGHQVGDKVLVHLAQLLSDRLRATDLRARWGGEEFVALLLDSDRDAALHTAEKLRKAVEDASVDVGLDEPVSITISIGVACFPDHGADEKELFARADAALYRAKDSGRNRVECG